MHTCIHAFVCACICILWSYICMYYAYMYVCLYMLERSASVCMFDISDTYMHVC